MLRVPSCLRCGPLLLVGALAYLLTAAAAAAQAPNAQRDAARSHFEAALRAYEEGSYQSALELLEQAHALFPSHAFFYNMAQAQRQLGQCRKARENYLRFLANETKPERRALAEVGLDRMHSCREPTAS